MQMQMILHTPKKNVFIIEENYACDAINIGFIIILIQLCDVDSIVCE